MESVDARGSQAWTRPSLPPWTRYRAEAARHEISGESVWMTRSGRMPLASWCSRAFHASIAPPLVPTANRRALWPGVSPAAGSAVPEAEAVSLVA